MLNENTVCAFMSKDLLKSHKIPVMICVKKKKRIISDFKYPLPNEMTHKSQLETSSFIWEQRQC